MGNAVSLKECDMWGKQSVLIRAQSISCRGHGVVEADHCWQDDTAKVVSSACLISLQPSY